MHTTDPVGTWVTQDRHIRHELLPDGRYVEARGRREAAYTGRYWMEGNHVEYLDDTGFTADGDFVDGVLHHAGMVMHRVGAEEGAG
ncbi:Atu4866 domain-containing protein [Auraticoccus monumenti]|uniref:Atu4866 domain-containing protein n=1 Tax=Auraticoccus monumenti TaxID=675864 RepID=UPI0018D3EAA5|nr:Atu4866 domain-containing protein [Auraticoccus monumenti]